MKYLALLRGINVGGNRTVPMAELRGVFEHAGYTDVSTYINSGNVVFSAPGEPDRRMIESQLAAQFGFAIDMLVLSQVKFAAVADAVPDEWANDTMQKSDVAFLFADVDSPDILQRVGYKPEVETMLYVPGAVIMNVMRHNQSKASLLKIVGTPLYRRMTIRNVTTVRKLAKTIG